MSDTVVFFLTSLYSRRILWRIRIVFTRPQENTKTMEIRCMASSFSKNLRFARSHENDKLASSKTPLWGPFFISRKYRLLVS